MTNLNPTPYVLMNGVEMPLSLTQGNAVVLDNLTINWGRSNHLDDVSPATLSLTVLDRDGAWVKSQQLLGMEIITGVRFTDSQGIARDFKNFRGRIVEAECVARERDLITGTDHGYLVYIRATDKLAELGNRFLSNQSWPSEYYETRKARFEAALSGVVAGVGGAYVVQQLQYSATAFDQKSLLDLITEHMAAGVEWVNYDPDTNRVEATGRESFTTPGWTGLRLALTDDGSGLYGLETDVSDFYAPFPRHHYNVDAGSLIPKSGVRRTIESGITEILYEYSTDAAGTKGTYVLGTGLNEAIYGRRTYAVKTENMKNVAVLAGIYQGNAQDAQTWQPPEVEWDTRIQDKGFQSFVQVRSFISGRAWPSPIFLSRNSYNSFPSKVPIYRVIGGSMTYSADNSGDMGWIVQPHFAPLAFATTFTPLAWNTINPSTSPVIGWDDLDNTVTWNDINLTGQGV